MSVKPYAHPHPEKVLKHLIYVWHGHGMQCLNQSVVAWFAHLHQVGFQPTLVMSCKHGTGDVCTVNKVREYHSMCKMVGSVYVAVEIQHDRRSSR